MPSLYAAFCLQHQHQRLELRVLLVPAPAQLLQPVDAVRARLVRTSRSRRRAPRRRCRRPARRVTIRSRGPAEQLAVVADQQHRLRRSRAAAPPATACRGRRGSCPARRAAAPRPGRAAAPPARAASARRRTACAPRATGARSYGTPSAATRAGVPERLGLVAAGVGPVGQRLRVAHLGRLVVALHHRQLGGVDARPRPSRTARRRHARRSRSRTRRRRRATLPMNWRITPSPPLRDDAALVRGSGRRR